MHTRKTLPACKTAPRPGRSRRSRLPGPAAFTFAASLSFGTLSSALAGPTGGVVVEGQGTISTPAAGQTLIDQASRNLHLNWSSFNVGASESVQFRQPSSSAVAFNRILDQNPSQIFGSIQANGQVVLVNPNGLLIGRTAQLNVGSLVASSLDAIDFDAASGRYRFSASRDRVGAVINEGLITAGRGGSVTLLGGQVTNTGAIVADFGTVNLAAGRAATLDLAGDGLLRLEVSDDLLTSSGGSADAVLNSGTVQANGGTVLLSASAVQDVFANLVNNTGVVRANRIENIGGTIRLVGAGGTVESSGTLDASAGDAVSTGGSVAVLGDRVGLLGDAVVDVSGATGGGEALIGGDFQGRNPDVLNASRTYVSAGTTINADAGVTGEGGRVIVWSDEVTRFGGHISARGGTLSGDGGFAEVSGKQTLLFRGTADLGAQNGAKGTLLLDPDDITINDSDDTDPELEDDGIYEADEGTSPTIGNQTIERLLADADVILQATNDITQEADATIDVSGEDDALGNALTLDAGRDILLAGGITTNNGDVRLLAGRDITMQNGSSINAGSGDVDVLAGRNARVTDITSSAAVVITATTGNITDDGVGSTNVAADLLTLTAGGAIGTVSTAIDTDADTITATASDGGVYIDESDDVTLNIIQASTGNDVIITAGDDVTVTSVTASGGDIEITSSGGGIAVGTVTADNVTLTAGGGSITDNTSSITATDLTLDASQGIGALGAVINTNVDSLTATADAGSVYIDEADAITLTDVHAAGSGSDVVINAGDTITVATVSAADDVTLTAAAGSILDDDDNDTRISADHLTLTATAGAIGAAGNGQIDTTVTSLNANAGAGSIFIGEQNGLTLTGVTSTNAITVTSASGNITVGTVTATNAVSLTANGTGSILDDSNNATRIASSALTLAAGGSIGTDASDIDTNVATLTANAGNGGVFIGELDGLTLTNVTAAGANNDVAVTSNSGNIVVGTVTAPDAVTLTANGGGSILDDGNNGTRIGANSLTLTAGGAIGAAGATGQIDTTVTSLTATAGAGSVHVGELNGLTLTNVTANGAGSDVAVTSDGGNITVNSVSATNAVTLAATAGSILDDGNDGTQISAGAGGVTLSAATNVGTVDDFAALAGSSVDVNTAGALAVTSASNTGQINLNISGAPNLSAPGAITLGDGSGSNGYVVLQSSGNFNATSLGAGAINIGDGNTTSVALSSGGVLTLGGSGFTDAPADSLLVHGATDVVDSDGTPRVFTFAANNLNFQSGAQGGATTLNTTVGRLDATIGNGQSLTVQETNAVMLGSISVVGGTFMLMAGGAVTDDGVNTTRIVANSVGLSGTALGAAGNELDTAAGSLTATATGGGIYVRELDALTLTAANATGGAVDVRTADGALTVATATGTGVTLVAGGANSALTLNGVVNGGAGNVTLTSGTGAGGGIVANAGHHVSGNALAATGTAIGTGAARLNTTVSSLNAAGGNGGIFVTETDGLTLTATSGTGALNVQTGGALAVTSASGNGVTLSTTGDGNGLTVNGAVSGGAGGVTLTTSGAGSDIRTDGSVSSTAGNIELAANGAGSDITVSSAITTPGNVTLTAGSVADRGAIIDEGGQISANLLTAVGSSIGSASSRLHTTVSSLDATSTNGVIAVQETDGLNLTASATGGGLDVITTNGSLTVAAASGNAVNLAAGGNGDLTLNSALNTGAGAVSLAAGDQLAINANVSTTGTVSLVAGSNAADAITLNATVAGTNVNMEAGTAGSRGGIVAGAGSLVTGTNLVVRGSSVGSSAAKLNTAVDSLDVLASNGGAFVSEADALSLEAAVTGGTLDVETLNGALTVGSATGDGVRLVAGGDGNGITVNGGSSGGVQAGAGAVTITTTGAGSHIVLNDAVSSTGNVALITGAGGDIVLNSVVEGSSSTITAGTVANRGAVIAGASSNLAADAATIVASSIGSSAARLNTAAQTLDTTSTSGGTFITELDGVALTASATGGVVDVATRTAGVLAVNSVTADGVTLTSGGPGGGIALNGVIDAGAGDVTLTAGSAADRGAITAGAGAQINASSLTAIGASIGTGAARLNTNVATLIATSTNGGTFVTEADALDLTANATGGAVDVQTTSGALTVGAAGGTGVTLTAGGAGSTITLNGAVNGGMGDVTLTAGTAGDRGAIVGNAGHQVSGNALAIDASAVGSSAASLNTNVTSLSATASNGGVYIAEQDGLTLASVTAAGANGHVNVTSTSGDITVGTVSAAGNASLTANGGAIRDDGDDTSRLAANTLTLRARSIGAPATLTGATLDSSGRLDTSVSTLDAAASDGGVFIDELDGLLSVSVQAGGGAAGDIELLTATGDLNLLNVTASDTLLLAAGHNIFALPGAAPITARVAELRAGGVDPGAGRIGTSTELLQLNLSAGNSLRLFVPQTVDPNDPTRAPSTLPSPGVLTTLSLFGSPDARATSAGFGQFQSLSDSQFTSQAEALARTIQNQTNTVQTVQGLDWASYDPNVSLFGTLDPAVCLPGDQRDEESGAGGC